MKKLFPFLLLLPVISMAQVNTGPVLSLNTKGGQISYTTKPMRWNLRATIGAEVLLTSDRLAVAHLTYGLQYMPFEKVSPVLIWNNGLSIESRFGEGGAGVKVWRIIASGTFRVYGSIPNEYGNYDGWMWKVAIQL